MKNIESKHASEETPVNTTTPNAFSSPGRWLTNPDSPFERASSEALFSPKISWIPTPAQTVGPLVESCKPSSQGQQMCSSSFPCIGPFEGCPSCANKRTGSIYWVVRHRAHLKLGTVQCACTTTKTTLASPDTPNSYRTLTWPVLLSSPEVPTWYRVPSWEL